jgi:hypothetical protein
MQAPASSFHRFVGFWMTSKPHIFFYFGDKTRSIGANDNRSCAIKKWYRYRIIKERQGRLWHFCVVYKIGSSNVVSNLNKILKYAAFLIFNKFVFTFAKNKTNGIQLCGLNLITSQEFHFLTVGLVIAVKKSDELI